MTDVAKVLLVGGLAVAAVIGGAVWLGAQRTGPATGPPKDAGAAESTLPRYIAKVTSERIEDGMVYHVRPTRAGRLAVGDALDLAFDQAVDLGLPRQTNLRQQFLCHPLSVIARAKPTWDLEAWRPDVGQFRTMLAACDPE